MGSFHQIVDAKLKAKAKVAIFPMSPGDIIVTASRKTLV